MGIMAKSAILNYRIVLKDKRTLIPGMAAQTKVVQTLVDLEHAGDQVSCPMGLVATGAAHLALPDRVVRYQVTLGLDALMTLAAEIKLIGVGK